MNTTVQLFRICIFAFFAGLYLIFDALRNHLLRKCTVLLRSRITLLRYTLVCYGSHRFATKFATQNACYTTQFCYARFPVCYVIPQFATHLHLSSNQIANTVCNTNFKLRALFLKVIYFLWGITFYFISICKIVNDT